MEQLLRRWSVLNLDLVMTAHSAQAPKSFNCAFKTRGFIWKFYLKAAVVFFKESVLSVQSNLKTFYTPPLGGYLQHILTF